MPKQPVTSSQDRIQPEADPLVDESDHKVAELREENRRLITQLEKAKNVGDDRLTTLQSENDQLRGELQDLKVANGDAEDGRPVKSTTFEIVELPSQKEIYLAIVAGISPSLALGTERMSDDTVNKVAKHCVGISQIFHRETRRKFTYGK